VGCGQQVRERDMVASQRIVLQDKAEMHPWR
jgi:hypothetical protein